MVDEKDKEPKPKDLTGPCPEGCEDRPPVRMQEGQACILSRVVRARMWKIAVDQLKDEGKIPKDLPWL